jgi:hypothetical protein
MKYFLMEENKKNPNDPQIIDWYGKINVLDINRYNCAKIPKKLGLKVRNNKDLVFPEIVFFPFLIVSDKVYELIKKFEPNMKKKDIILTESAHGNVKVYHLPIFEELNCLSDKSKLNADKSVIHEAVIEETLAGDKSIFVLEGINKRQVVVRLDVAEALLRRDINCFNLREVTVI